jgi:hypothetical protein
VRDGKADEDCKTGADDNEEGHQDAVEGWRLVGGLAGHCGERWLVVGEKRGYEAAAAYSSLVCVWMLRWRSDPDVLFGLQSGRAIRSLLVLMLAAGLGSGQVKSCSATL